MRFLLALSLLVSVSVAHAQGQQVTDPRYDLAVSIRPTDRFLSVSGTAVIPPKESPQTTLSFQLAQQVNNLQMEVVSPPTSAGVLNPKMLSDNGLGSGNWSADLAKPVPSGTPITVKFSYDGGEKTAFVFHIDTGGSYACGSDIAWYPEFGIASTTGKYSVDGNGQVIGSVTYSLPSDLQIVANGRKSEPTVSGAIQTVGFVTDHASALSFVVDKFRVLHGKGKVPVSLYFKSDLGDDAAYITGIQRVVDLLATVYGAFPFPEFSLVELSDKAVEGAGFGGAGCAGFMMSTTSFLDQGFNYAFFGHEIGHQWWGNLVTHVSETEGHDLLDEAMAQYGSLYCVEHLIGTEAAKRYRTTGYPGYVPTQNGLNYLNMSTAGFDHELENLDETTGLGHELACEKGFLVFDQLRREVGDEAFHRGLRAVTKDYAFRSISLAQFKQELEKAAHQNLGWFWDQWLKRKGAPHLWIEWSQKGSSVQGTLHQSDPPYRLHVPISVTTSDGSTVTLKLRLDGSTADFQHNIKGVVTTVLIDPNFEVLHYTPELEERAKAMLPVTNVVWSVFSGGTKSAALLEHGLKANVSPDRYGVAFRLHYYRATSLSRSKKYEEAAREITVALECPTRDETLMPRCYELMSNVYKELEDLDRATWAANSAILAEKELGQHTGVSKSMEAWLKAHVIGH